MTIGAVLLAAGLSRRMGRNKLLADFGGVPMIRRSALCLAAAQLAPLVVVTGHEAPEIEAALRDLPLRFVHNRDYESGLSTSLALGISALERTDAEGALVALGDMPLIAPAHIRRLAAAYHPRDRPICVPLFDGKQGNPVIWAPVFFGELKCLSGDRGAKALLDLHEEQVTAVAMDDPAVLIDIDTPEALREHGGR